MKMSTPYEWQPRVIGAVLDVFEDGATFTDQDLQVLLPEVSGAAINRTLHLWQAGKLQRKMAAHTLGAKITSTGQNRARRWYLHRYGIPKQQAPAVAEQPLQTLSPPQPDPQRVEVLAEQANRLLIRLDGSLYLAIPFMLGGA